MRFLNIKTDLLSLFLRNRFKQLTHPFAPWCWQLTCRMSFKVTDWLSSEMDYQQGISILKELDSENAVLSLCTAECNSFTKELLRDELLLLAPKKKEDAVVPKSKQIIWAELPPQFMPLRRKLKEIFTDQNRLRDKLRTLNTAAERKPLCEEILSLDAVKMDIYLSVDVFHEKGIIPNTTKSEVVTVEERAVHYMRCLSRNPPYISKYKNDPTRADEVAIRREELSRAKKIIETGVFV